MAAKLNNVWNWGAFLTLNLLDCTNFADVIAADGFRLE